MIASGDLTGLLHIEWSGHHEIDHDTQDLVHNISDMITLSLSNTRLRETLRNQSIRDPLTGVFNRRYLDETLIRELPRAKRKGAPIGVMMLDIDHFKVFNDTYGHEAGDYVLKKLGDLLINKTRKEDIVCRYGGEEFCLIMPEATLQTTYDRAELIRNATNELNLVDGQVPLGNVSVSIGVAIFPEHGVTGVDVIQAADKALYRAKAEGRNRVIKA
jgi:diguanylate cyclase (GGDEF)-like protein